MKIKFLRPVQGLAYFENDVADLPGNTAANLVQNGFAIMVPDTIGENTLPKDLPAREILFENGLETITDVKNALESITDFNGIGAKTAQRIKDYFAT